ncbi:RimJ/RimL family protein N-acetyltransferase [Mucilaginibacter yixingensis]|uniref:RimJ/RimL family protein N-acetyltransferase n=1 Tax=Mucilaginibacter yixingensis TaxID=1295612 RepID=A0A2T5J9I5_9SPHI|nr:GNAT family protein [Mucilaginibacter yixingensis]PTQ96669.1 RimJ/RimL family protein N-acetyltransferase [Mucilaginibacter yixingensis]
MRISVYIRPLKLDDAQTSYLWRNDSQVWLYTNFKAVGYITKEQEKEWLREKLTHNDEKRFAICVKELDTYIGNVQLLDIKDHHAELHLFIGNKLYWGKGIGYQATLLTAKFGFEKMNLDDIYLRVHPANVPALAIYEKAGFEISGKNEGLITMHLTKDRFLKINTYTH